MKINKNAEVMERGPQTQKLTSANKAFQTYTLLVLLKYGVAVASVLVVAAILQWWNVKIILYDPPHTLLFLFAVLLSTWVGGPGPGFLAMALSLLVFVFYYLAPNNLLAIHTSDLPSLLVFGLVTLTVVLLTTAQKRMIESLKKADEELKESNLLLQVEINERKRVEKALRESEAKLKEAGQLASIGYWEWDLIADRITRSEETAHIFGLQSSESALSRSQLLDMIHPEDRQLLQRALVETLQERQSLNFEFRIVRPEGDLRHIHVRNEIEFNESGQPVRLFGALQDITGRKQAEEELRRYATRMKLLAEISRDSEAVGLDYQNILDTLVRLTALQIGDSSIILLFSDDGQQVFPAAFYHHDPAAHAMFKDALLRYPQNCTDNPYFQSLFSGNSVYIPVVNEAEFRTIFRPEILPVLDTLGVSSFIIAPLRGPNHVIGGLAIIRDRHGTAYTPDDHVLVQDLADRASLAIQNARFFEQVEDARLRLEALSGRLLAVQEEERRTIARELHDEVGQTLGGLIMQLGMAKSLLPKSARPVRNILDQVETLAQQTLEFIRMIIAGLRPPVLDDLGLIPAVRRLGSEFQEETGIQIEMNTTRLTERLPVPLEVALFRIVQEALTNVRKHARAQRVGITLAMEDGTVRLSIQDDGVGIMKQISPSSTNSKLILEGGWHIPTGHFGLIGIQERVTQLGGRLDLTSVPGQGTTLVVEIPLTETKVVPNENP